MMFFRPAFIECETRPGCKSARQGRIAGINACGAPAIFYLTDNMVVYTLWGYGVSHMPTPDDF
jgi:hypothetical protein